jgi:L-threonylcarbamoyladenylate synthase
MTGAALIAADAAGIERAATAIAAGQAVGMPTETVYGLAADATNPQAVANIYAIKGRPEFNPLIAHVASIEDARAEGCFDARAIALAEAFWPGPLTLVVPVQANGKTSELARAGLGTIALRIPKHPVAQALLAACGTPLAAPSANPSGRLSPTQAKHVAAELGAAVALVIDGGSCAAGIESSIVAALPGEPLRLLRPGAISRAALEAVAGTLASSASGNITSPGQLNSHYAPGAQLRLNATHAEAHEVLLAFGQDAPPTALNLSARGDLVEAAANLYAHLRELDTADTDSIAVMTIPTYGLGEAINDRLHRAAAPR